MEPLVENFNELKLTSLKTGLVYNEQMLLHSPAPKKHYENPTRLEAILSHLNAKSMIQNPNLDFIQHINPALDSCIMACHTSSYIEYVAEMFPPECEKKSIFIFDSYYNKYTNLAARVAVSSINLCVDKVMNKEWKNAYALVRPPGHHSGHHTTINGFCVFNNVAIAARYAQRVYNVKKILIFDWDVHHGDGTESIFYKDSSVLYASIHRYENGLFYPNKGSSDRIGEGDGKGFNINIGWNHEEECEDIANDEYIYAFERVLFPIFKEFNPELIFVSSGFDSCRGDPLGDLELTPDGYAYMLRRLQSLADGKIILALEGGYNTKSLSICSENVIRVLMNEKIPLVCSENMLNMENMLFFCKPNKIALEAVDTVVKYIHDIWGNALDDKESMEFQENVKIMNFLKSERGKKHLVKGDKFLKKTNENEKTVYLNKTVNFGDFLCKFYGVETILGEDYVKLENLFSSNRSSLNVIEVKLGKTTYVFNENKEKMMKRLEKDEKSSSNSLGFRVSHVNILNENHEIEEIHTKMKSKKYETNELIEILFRKFIFNKIAKEEDQKNVFTYFQENLEKLAVAFEKPSSEFWRSISLIFLVNFEQKSWNLKLVDFCEKGTFEKEMIDYNILDGIQNLRDIFKSIL